MAELEELSDLVLDIYDTALDPGRWPDVLEKVSHYVGARGAFIFELQGVGPAQNIFAPFFSSSYDPAIVTKYLQVHNQQELADQEIFARLSRRTDRIQLIGDDVLTETEEELVARANVQEMMRNGLRYRAGALLNKDQLNHDRFALQFSKRGGPITAETARKAELILPHIAKALNVSRPTTQLALNSARSPTALTSLSSASAFLTPTARSFCPIRNSGARWTGTPCSAPTRPASS